MLDPITSGGVLTNDGGNGGGRIIRPACAARHPRAPERPAKKSADEPTGDDTDRTSDH